MDTNSRRPRLMPPFASTSFAALVLGMCGVVAGPIAPAGAIGIAPVVDRTCAMQTVDDESVDASERHVPRRGGQPHLPRPQ
ncbi:hypothetical protein GCM10009775_02530 [Microbacterium aoyamense]|uniref:Secreted protein n=1 Tax=Microbacterium aoyamense TaxID=344166 RepID=A0ABN2P6I4_9MICO|nr:hypothetical protein [Microbacterium aoyamense]